MAKIVKAVALDKTAWISLLKGAAIAAVGAVLTYVTQNLASIDFGVWSPTVAAGFAILANYIRKWLEVWNTPAEPEPLKPSDF